MEATTEGMEVMEAMVDLVGEDMVIPDPGLTDNPPLDQDSLALEVVVVDSQEEAQEQEQHQDLEEQDAGEVFEVPYVNHLRVTSVRPFNNCACSFSNFIIFEWCKVYTVGGETSIRKKCF